MDSRDACPRRQNFHTSSTKRNTAFFAVAAAVAVGSEDCAEASSSDWARGASCAEAAGVVVAEAVAVQPSSGREMVLQQISC